MILFRLILDGVALTGKHATLRRRERVQRCLVPVDRDEETPPSGRAAALVSCSASPGDMCSQHGMEPTCGGV